jgi:hypothetical protein
VQDQYGNLETADNSDTVALTTSPSATLFGGSSATVSGGTATFSGLSVQLVGTYTLQASSGTLTGATSSGFTISPAAAAKLVFTGQPSSALAGASLGTVSVAVQDQYGNLETADNSDTVALATSPSATLFGGSSATVSGGTATFSGLSVQLVGTYTLQASSGTLTGATSSGFTISPAAAAKLVFTGQPSSALAGASLGTVSVAVQDQYGNLETADNSDTVALATSPSATLFGGSSATVSGGTATFSGLSVQLVGTYTLQASSGTLTGATSSGFTISPAAASTLVVNGFPSPTIAGVSHGFVVTAKDAFGNTATGYTGTVHVTSSDGQAALPADFTFGTANAGLHSFSAALKTVGVQSWTVTDTANSSITGTQSGITVNPAAASILVLTGFPSPSVAGAAGNVTVTATDSFGNRATGYAGTVHFTSTDAQAGLPADYTFTTGSTADNGVHTFSATLKTAGTQSLTATDKANGAIKGSQSGITVNPAAASTFVVAGFASPTTAGVAHNVTVTAKDTFGNIATGYTGTVHFTSSDPLAALPADYTFTTGSTADNGVHTFSATLKTVGSRSLTATDTASSSLAGTQAGITVNPAAASTLVVAGFPSPTTAGAAHNFTVTAKDPFGNTATGYTGTVHFTSSDAQAALPANYTFTGGDAGVHTFSATLKTAPAQSLTAADTVTSSITGTQNGITVNPAAANTLALSGFPSPSVAGTAGNVTVTAKDSFGNTATGYTGSVHFTSTDAQAGLPADYTFTTGSSADNGVHTFRATLKTAGTQSLTATDKANGAIKGSQGGITVNSAAASTLVVAGFTSPTTAGVGHNVTVTAKDAFGNIATSYTGTVHFTSSDAQAALPANYTFTTGGTADNGVHTFSATLKTVGSRSLTATDTASSSIAGTQAGITVNPAAASTYVVAGYASPTTAGAAHNFTVTATDPFGNTATGYRGEVRFSGSDAQATLPANYTFTAGDAGVHTFSATLKTASTQSLTATDTVTSSITGTQSGITVTPAAASTLVLNGFPSPTMAGTAGNVTVTARDSFGNTATGYSGTVHFTSTDAQAGLPADYTFTTGSSADNGVHTFSATLKTAGTQSLTATDKANGAIKGSQSGITVNPAAASSLVVAGYPSPTTAGVAHNFTVTAKDAFGNTATGYTGTVHFTSSDGKAALPANYTFTTGTNADNGVHTFSATFKTAATQSLTATDTVTKTIAGTQSGITVNPTTASAVVINAPATVTHGQQFSFTVTVVDAFGNTVTGYTGTLHFKSSDSNATLPANYTFTANDKGVHTFTATFRTSGTQSLTATDTSNSGITGTQSGIVVAAADVDDPVQDGALDSEVGEPTPPLLKEEHTRTRALAALVDELRDLQPNLVAENPEPLDALFAAGWNNAIEETADSGTLGERTIDRDRGQLAAAVFSKDDQPATQASSVMVLAVAGIYWETLGKNFAGKTRQKRRSPLENRLCR